MSMREEFEAWATSLGGIGRVYRSHEPGRTEDYEDQFTQVAWKSWQASRESLVIELPNAPYMEYGESAGRYFGIKVSRDAIHAAGIKTK